MLSNLYLTLKSTYEHKKWNKIHLKNYERCITIDLCEKKTHNRKIALSMGKWIKMLSNNENSSAANARILVLTSIFCIMFGGICFAADDYATLVNENFETGYIDRGDVGKNITLSEQYDGFADKRKCGYMISQQVTAYSYNSDYADRAGYNPDDRVFSGENAAYGKLGSALYLYPNINSSDTDWWICVQLGYDGITASELSDKTLDINFNFADGGDAGRTAEIKLCADAEGEEKEYLIGINSIKKGLQFLNSYHKRINLADILNELSPDTEFNDVRIKITAPKGKTSSVVKLDDIHIREVNPKEFISWDFDAEDCFTKDFTKDTAKLSTADGGEIKGRALKIESQTDNAQNSVRFKIPNLKSDSVFKISLKAKVPLSNAAGDGIKIRLVNIGLRTWEIGEAENSDEFKIFTKEISLSDFYGVGSVENAALEISFNGNAGDMCYLDDLAVCKIENTSETFKTVNKVNENFETGYVDRGDVHGNIHLSERYDGFADKSLCGYMVYKQILASDYTKNEADRACYDADDREYSTLSEKWGKLGSAIHLYPQKEEWWIDTDLGYMPMSGKEFAKKALDINITFADSGSSERKASAVLCYKVNGEKRESLIDEKAIKNGKAFLNSYHRRIHLSEISGDLADEDIISNISFKLAAPTGQNESIVKFDDIHIRETDPNEINGWDFEAEDLYTTNFSNMTERLSSVKTDDGTGRMLKIRAINAEYLKQTRFDLAGIDENTVMDISFKIKLPKSNSVQRGADIQLRYMETSGDLNIGKIANSDEFIEFKKTVALSQISGLNSDFSRAALEVKFEGAVGDVCYIDDLSIKAHSDDDNFIAEVQDGASEYFPTSFLYVHFNKEMDIESIKHAGNVRVNDSADIINRIELVNKTDMIITLNEKMQEGYRYIVELRNLRSTDGYELSYKKYALLVKNDKSKSVITVRYQPSYKNGVQEVMLPFVLNCDTEAKKLTYAVAAYDGSGSMLTCNLHELYIGKGDYAKNLQASMNFSETADTAETVKIFLWEDGMIPVKNSGKIYTGLQSDTVSG